MGRFAIHAALAVTMLLLGVFVPGAGPSLEAQEHPHQREGFWISAGFGYGSLGLEGLSGREPGLSGNLTLGGTIGDRFLLGAGTTGWTREVEGIRVTFGTLAVMARLYPEAESGFFIDMGLGGGQVSLSEGRIYDLSCNVLLTYQTNPGIDPVREIQRSIDQREEEWTTCSRL